MHRLKSLFVALAVVMCQATMAMDVSAYEAILKESQSEGAGKYMSRAAIDNYFNGVAVTLQYFQAGSQSISRNDIPLLCFPSNVKLTGALLRGALDGELLNPKIFSETLGPEWKKFELVTFIIPSLARLFPCQK